MANKGKKFWSFRAAADPKVGELYLHGDISSYSWWGDEITPKQFKEDMDALGDITELHVYINSNGGDVFAGHAIHSMLKRKSASGCRVIVHVDGLAASIASVICMAGDVVKMPRNTMMMIHNPWTITWGNAEQLRKMAEDLDKIAESLVAAYQDKTGLSEEEIRAIMDAETWLTADECVEKGFADEIEAEKKVAASLRGDLLAIAGQQFDLSRFRNAPMQKLAAKVVTEPAGEVIEETVEERPEDAEPGIQAEDDTSGLPPAQEGNEPAVDLAALAKMFAELGGTLREFMNQTTATLMSLTEAVASMRAASSVSANTESPAATTQEPAVNQSAEDAGDEPLLVIGEEPLLVIEDAPSEEVTIEAETLQQAIKAAVDEGMKEFRFKMTGRVD